VDNANNSLPQHSGVIAAAPYQHCRVTITPTASLGGNLESTLGTDKTGPD